MWVTEQHRRLFSSARVPSARTGLAAWAVLAASAALLAAGCSPSDTSAAPTSIPAPTSTALPTSTLPATSTSDQSRVDSAYVPALGATVLVDSSGYPLYVFAPDNGKKVTCTGACAAVWPPLKLPSGSEPSAGSGVDAHLLGSDPDPAGGSVITYNGWPLYTYTTDLKLGMGSTVAEGEGLDLNGGYWYVMRANGSPIVHRVPPKT